MNKEMHQRSPSIVPLVTMLGLAVLVIGFALSVLAIIVWVNFFPALDWVAAIFCIPAALSLYLLIDFIVRPRQEV